MEIVASVGHGVSEEKINRNYSTYTNIGGNGLFNDMCKVKQKITIVVTETAT